MDRWINYKGSCFNLKFVAYFGVFKTEIYAYMNFGSSYEAPSKMNNSDGGRHTHCLFLGSSEEAGEYLVDPEQAIKDIISGCYDMKTPSQ